MICVTHLCLCLRFFLSGRHPRGRRPRAAREEQLAMARKSTGDGRMPLT